MEEAADEETYYWSQETEPKDEFACKLIGEHRGLCPQGDDDESELPLRRKKSTMQHSESNGANDKSKVPTCAECGKTFTSSKALYGHLRCHPSRDYRGANRPPAASAPDPPKPLPAAKTWSVTARRGRKATISEVHSHELAAVRLLLLFSESKRQQSAPPSNRRTSYTCTTCNQTFSSHQALGGHRANHSKQKELEVGMLERAKMVESNNSAMATPMAVAAHRCKICNMTFPTGQALGGHKRKHRVISDLEISKRNHEGK